MHSMQLWGVTSQRPAYLLPPAARQRWLSIESNHLQIQRAAAPIAEQREEARDPSIACSTSGLSCSMTRASSSKARACDIYIFCQHHPSDNNFRSRQLREAVRDQSYPTFRRLMGCADFESKLLLPDRPVVAGGEYATHPPSRT